jgi:hypothetical protein
MAQGGVQRAVKAAIKAYLGLSRRATLAAHEAAEAWSDLVAEVRYERSSELMELRATPTRPGGSRRARAQAAAGRPGGSGDALADPEPLERRAEDRAASEGARPRHRRPRATRPAGD